MPNIRSSLGYPSQRTDESTEDKTNWSWYEWVRDQLTAPPHPCERVMRSEGDVPTCSNPNLGRNWSERE